MCRTPVGFRTFLTVARIYYFIDDEKSVLALG